MRDHNLPTVTTLTFDVPPPVKNDVQSQLHKEFWLALYTQTRINMHIDTLVFENIPRDDDASSLQAASFCLNTLVGRSWKRLSFFRTDEMMEDQMGPFLTCKALYKLL